MKCQYCGAEIAPGNTVCNFCGAQITPAMRMEQQQLNKAGCPRCGSANIAFNWAVNGAVNGKKGAAMPQAAMGFCKDCGYTWQTTEQQKKRKTWLWVLGWIFIFPLPLTLILVKRDTMKPIVKYGLIAIAWIFWLLLGMGARNSEPDTGSERQYIETQEANAVDSIELVAGQTGKYGKEIVMNEGTDLEEHLVIYGVPSGKYLAKNLGSWNAQVSVYRGIVKTAEGYDEYAETGDAILLMSGEEKELNIPDGWFVELSGGTDISLTRAEAATTATTVMPVNETATTAPAAVTEVPVTTVSKEAFINSCTELPYKELARNPDAHINENFYFTAYISSARTGDLFSGYQRYYISYAYDSAAIEEKKADYENLGWDWDDDDAKMYGTDYDVCVWLVDNRNEADADYVKIIEDDIIRVYGTFTGLTSSKNGITNETSEQVSLDIKYVELISE